MVTVLFPNGSLFKSFIIFIGGEACVFDKASYPASGLVIDFCYVPPSKWTHALLPAVFQYSKSISHFCFW